MRRVAALPVIAAVADKESHRNGAVVYLVYDAVRTIRLAGAPDEPVSAADAARPGPAFIRAAFVNLGPCPALYGAVNAS